MTCTAATHAALKRDLRTFLAATTPLLHHSGYADDGAGGTLLLRNCRRCKSTLAIVLDETELLDEAVAA